MSILKSFLETLDFVNTITTPDNRISKTEYYMSIAKSVATRSTCLRRKYGAIIVKNDEIIATGYNGSPRGCKNCSTINSCLRKELGIKGKEHYELCKSVHAEMNCVISAKRSDMIGSTMYLCGLNPDGTTHKSESCSLCKKMIINSGISRVVTSVDDNNFKITDTNSFIDDINNIGE